MHNANIAVLFWSSAKFCHTKIRTNPRGAPSRNWNSDAQAWKAVSFPGSIENVWWGFWIISCFLIEVCSNMSVLWLTACAVDSDQNGSCNRLLLFSHSGQSKYYPIFVKAFAAPFCIYRFSTYVLFLFHFSRRNLVYNSWHGSYFWSGMFDSLLYDAGQTLVMIFWSLLVLIVAGGVIGKYFSRSK